jgi:hypothetical protein
VNTPATAEAGDCAHRDVTWMRALWLMVITGAICRDCGVSWPLLGLPADVIDHLPEGPRRDALREAARDRMDNL